ncbi:MAG TPA: 30S ribosome-binding factor RbfA [Verrucomicrobiae bacterium]
MSNLRQERVRELLRRAIGEAIRREFHVSDVGLITVNDIDVGGDLKSAVVFITILGNPTQQKHGLQVLEQNRIRLQSLVANSVVLKYTPTLKFIVDDSIVRGNRVLQILDELEKKSASSGTGVSPVRSDGNEA